MCVCARGSLFVLYVLFIITTCGCDVVYVVHLPAQRAAPDGVLGPHRVHQLVPHVEHLSGDTATMVPLGIVGRSYTAICSDVFVSRWGWGWW